MQAHPPTERVRLRRGPSRARYDEATVRSILSDALYCHVAADVGGTPAIIPTAFALIDDHLVVHGSTANRVLRAMRDGGDCCLCVTLLDGLVLARSHFHHSVNYRAVVVYGRAREISDPSEKRRALAALIDHMVPGRSAEGRPPSPDELRRTLVLALPLAECSAKVRSGPPVDEEEDYALDVWAGEIPLRLTAVPPVADADLRSPVPVCVAARAVALGPLSPGSAG